MDLGHRESFCGVVAGAPERPLYAPGAGARLRVAVLVPACDRGGPPDIGHMAHLAIRAMNVSGQPQRRHLPVQRNPVRRAMTGRDLPASRSGGGRRDGDAGGHGQEFPAIVEQHDTVAQQAPPLLRMAGHGPRGAAIGRQGTRAPRLMPARLVPRQPSGSGWRGSHGSSRG